MGPLSINHSRPHEGLGVLLPYRYCTRGYTETNVVMTPSETCLNYPNKGQVWDVLGCRASFIYFLQTIFFVNIPPPLLHYHITFIIINRL